MKRVFRKSFIVAIIIVLGCLVFFQLRNNKLNNKEIASLSNIRGRFYPVKTQIVEPEQLSDKLELNGFLIPDIDLDVISETRGRIITIFKEKGSYVNVGDVIAKVDDELLQSQLEATKAAVEQLGKEEKRFMKLYKSNAVPGHQLEEIQLNLKTTQSKLVTAIRQLEDTKIKAPVGGLINDDFIDLGMFISGGSKICNIVSTQSFKLNLKVSEQDLSTVTVGQEVIVKSKIYPKAEFIGKINVIAQKAGMGNSFNVEVGLKNSIKNPLNGGMYVTAELTEKSDSSKIYVPRRAINGSLKDATIYVINKDKALLKNVVVGISIGDKVEIISGLQDGEEVVVAGNYNIYDGAIIKVMN